MTAQTSWVEVQGNGYGTACRFCHRSFLIPKAASAAAHTARDHLVGMDGQKQFITKAAQDVDCRPWADFTAFNTRTQKCPTILPSGVPRHGSDLVISDAKRRILPVARNLEGSSTARSGKVYTERTRAAPSCSGTAALEARSLSMTLEDDFLNGIHDDGDGDDSACDPPNLDVEESSLEVESARCDAGPARPPTPPASAEPKDVDMIEAVAPLPRSPSAQACSSSAKASRSRSTSPVLLSPPRNGRSVS